MARKLENFLNVNSANSMLDVMDRFVDSSGVMLSRHLTTVDPKFFTTIRPENIFLKAGFTIRNSGGAGDSILSLRLDTAGSFTDVTDTGTNLGRIALSAEENRIAVKEKQLMLAYTKGQLEKAQKEEINIYDVLLQGTYRQYHAEIDQALSLGINGKNGLLNNKFYAIDTPVTTKFKDLSGEDMYKYLSEFITEQKSQVNNAIELSANLFVLPVPIYNIIKVKDLTTKVTTKKVLGILKEDFPEIEFKYSFRANNVDGSLIGGLFSTDENSAVIRIPTPLEFSNPVTAHFNFETVARYRIAGADILDNDGGRLIKFFA